MSKFITIDPVPPTEEDKAIIARILAKNPYWTRSMNIDRIDGKIMQVMTGLRLHFGQHSRNYVSNHLLGID